LPVETHANKHNEEDAMKNTTHFIRKISLVTVVSGALLVPAMHTYAETEQQKSDTVESVKANMKEGWKEGMIEGAYLFNTNLNPLDIDVEVHGSKAILKGYVDSDVTKSLAKEIAISIDGVDEVDNQLQVNAEKANQKQQVQQGLMANISDTTITVKVKSKLLANTEVSGLKIDVDTDNKEVTLNGKVSTEAERDLVYYITRNTEGVRDVHNNLKVEGNS